MRVPATAKENRSAGLTPNVPWRVIQVTPLSGYCLRVRFVDGTEGEVDMTGLVNRVQAGVFEKLRDRALFAQVTVSLGAVTWPGDIDLAPDAMYDEIRKNGKWVL
ncbi:conserved hypothetical protein [Nitrosococcus halophilus Nc 4]|uniref:DUF2442 domain-containing protein n=1 Tax=Nitrosococcus halophilus (strain Nc4) TaxID=472759 RepID=D5C2K6_NITHN|nr:DUF2442 domain-containing protein [Nitrosococcus halophilus]ADE14865.1 conserved hypothetical protein [Nitrosococcus halophilus Nc 4]